MLSDAGQRGEALDVARRATDIYEGLATANPAAYLPDLAASLNNLANRLSDAGQRGEALDVARRATDIREGLATANPAAYLPDLAMSLNNLATMLSDAGQRGEALEAVNACVTRMAQAQSGPAAELLCRLWRNDEPDSTVPEDRLRWAATLAAAEHQPEWQGRSRKVLRGIIAQQPDDFRARLSDLPLWAVADIDAAVVSAVEEILAATSWAEAMPRIRDSAAILFDGPSLLLLAELSPGVPDLKVLLDLRRANEAGNLNAALEEVENLERHRHAVRGWLEQPTWTASRHYLTAQRRLLIDDVALAHVRMFQARAKGGSPLWQHVARHEEILALAMGVTPETFDEAVDRAYDLITHPELAREEVVQAVTRGDGAAAQQALVLGALWDDPLACYLVAACEGAAEVAGDKSPGECEPLAHGLDSADLRLARFALRQLQQGSEAHGQAFTDACLDGLDAVEAVNAVRDAPTWRACANNLRTNAPLLFGRPETLDAADAATPHNDRGEPQDATVAVLLALRQAYREGDIETAIGQLLFKETQMMVAKWFETPNWRASHAYLVTHWSVLSANAALDIIDELADGVEDEEVSAELIRHRDILALARKKTAAVPGNDREAIGRAITSAYHDALPAPPDHA
jgi:hypothetical protein